MTQTPPAQRRMIRLTQWPIAYLTHLKMEAALIRFALYTIIALVPVGCGTRKAATSINNTDQKNVTKDTSKGQVTKDSGNLENYGNSVANNVVNEQLETRITELFNENGTLKSRIIEFLNSKSTDNTISNSYIVKTAYSHTDSVFNNTHYIDRTITIHTKEKATTTNRNGLYWMIGIVLGIGLVFLFKPWK